MFTAAAFKWYVTSQKPHNVLPISHYFSKLYIQSLTFFCLLGVGKSGICSEHLNTQLSVVAIVSGN